MDSNYTIHWSVLYVNNDICPILASTLFLCLSDQMCAHLLVGFARASPYTQFALPTSGLLKCRPHVYRLVSLQDIIGPPPAPMNLPESPQIDWQAPPVNALGVWYPLLHHQTFSPSRVVVSWVMINVLLYAAYAMATLASDQNIVLFIHIVGQHTLSMKTLCWPCCCQPWNKCYFTTPAGEVIAY